MSNDEKSRSTDIFSSEDSDINIINVIRQSELNKEKEIIHKKRFQKRIINWFTIFFVGLVIECLFRDKFYDVGIIFIHQLQQIINKNYLLIRLFQILSFCASKYWIITMIIIIYNYLDPYSSLLLMIICSCASTGTGFFKLIYKNPRPFFHEDWVKVYDCETGFGNPSGHSIVAVSLYLTLYKILHLKMKFRKNVKYYLNFFVVFFIMLITLSRLALGAHSLNQIIFGSFLGAMIYALFFDVFKIDLNLTHEIYVIMQPKIFNIFSGIIITILGIGVIIFNFVPILNDSDTKSWGSRIKENCPNTPYSKLFDYEAYFMLAGCSSLIGGYLGIYFDIKYNMSGNIQNWINLNLGDTKWNKTSHFNSLLRFLLNVLFITPSFSLNFIISSKDTINVIFFLKNLIPYFAVSFTLYGFNRRLLVFFNIGINKKSKELTEGIKNE